MFSGCLLTSSFEGIKFIRVWKLGVSVKISTKYDMTHEVQTKGMRKKKQRKQSPNRFYRAEYFTRKLSLFK